MAVKIINWLDIQKTPEELIDTFGDEFDAKNISRMFVVHVDKDGWLRYTPASTGRDYTYSDILWDLEQFKFAFLKDQWEKDGNSS